MSNVVTVNGFLFSVLDRIGDRSEGPEYFLQLLEKYAAYDQIKKHHVTKNAPLHKQDPKLQQFLGRKVKITGVLSDQGIEYTAIGASGT